MRVLHFKIYFFLCILLVFISCKNESDPGIYELPSSFDSEETLSIPAGDLEQNHQNTDSLSTANHSSASSGLDTSLNIHELNLEDETENVADTSNSSSANLGLDFSSSSELGYVKFSGHNLRKLVTATRTRSQTFDEVHAAGLLEEDALFGESESKDASKTETLARRVTAAAGLGLIFRRLNYKHSTTSKLKHDEARGGESSSDMTNIHD